MVEFDCIDDKLLVVKARFVEFKTEMDNSDDVMLKDMRF
jgi:hypothetical protein